MLEIKRELTVLRLLKGGRSHFPVIEDVATSEIRHGVLKWCVEIAAPGSKTFFSVTCPETVDLEVTFFAKYFEGEQILPFHERSVHGGSYSVCTAENGHTTVIEGLLFKILRRCHCRDVDDFAQKPAEQIDHVTAYFKKMAATAPVWICAPFLFVARATADSVTTKAEKLAAELP